MKTLETLLEQVKSAVRTADFAQLAQLAPQLETALADLPTTAPIAVLERIKRQAESNAALLDAARRGTRAARRRIDEVRRASQGLQTYDNRGKMADFSTVTHHAGRF